MATLNRKKILTEGGFGGITPYGNVLALQFALETTAAGILVNGDSNSVGAAIGIGDKVRIGVIPAGTRISDALAIVSNAFTATSTAKVGFEYVDGVDVPAVPQNDSYFFAALAINAQGRTRANNLAVRPVVLPKDAYVIVTNQVAAQAEVGALDLIVDGATS
jgi:hypothetical protein